MSPPVPRSVRTHAPPTALSRRISHDGPPSRTSPPPGSRRPTGTVHHLVPERDDDTPETLAVAVAAECAAHLSPDRTRCPQGRSSR
ncbi:hypothetical protein F1D05_01640 [Kribbella qitaiheensis]|uniref:Uncharacterized protein n=1 Tax=Kribbella qitaiheensis TaxID=1544730 RepID=A0A7G6WS72_9ACTN|nr:hypothetical protein F1D05_01640 [Kribbella qitaiheensis]